MKNTGTKFANHTLKIDLEKAYEQNNAQNQTARIKSSMDVLNTSKDSTTQKLTKTPIKKKVLIETNQTKPTPQKSPAIKTIKQINKEISDKEMNKAASHAIIYKKEDTKDQAQNNIKGDFKILDYVKGLSEGEDEHLDMFDPHILKDEDPREQMRREKLQDITSIKTVTEQTEEQFDDHSQIN